MTDLPVAKAMLEKNLAHGGYAVHVLVGRDHGGTTHLQPLDPLVIKHVPHGSYHREPAFFLAPDAAQALLDGLWEAGIRPTSGTAVAENGNLAIDLLREHLADMRRLVFKPEEAPNPDRPMTIHRFPDPI